MEENMTAKKLKVFETYEDFSKHFYSVELKIGRSTLEKNDVLGNFMRLAHRLSFLKNDEILSKVISEKDFVEFCTNKNITQIEDLLNNTSALFNDTYIIYKVKDFSNGLGGIQAVIKDFFKESPVNFKISQEQKIPHKWLLHLMKDPRFTQVLHNIFQMKLPHNLNKAISVNPNLIKDVVKMTENDWQFVVQAIIFFYQYNIVYTNMMSLEELNNQIKQDFDEQ